MTLQPRLLERRGPRWRRRGHRARAGVRSARLEAWVRALRARAQRPRAFELVRVRAGRAAPVLALWPPRTRVVVKPLAAQAVAPPRRPTAAAPAAPGLRGRAGGRAPDPGLLVRERVERVERLVERVVREQPTIVAAGRPMAVASTTPDARVIPRGEQLVTRLLERDVVKRTQASRPQHAAGRDRTVVALASPTGSSTARTPDSTPPQRSAPLDLAPTATATVRATRLDGTAPRDPVPAAPSPTAAADLDRVADEVLRRLERRAVAQRERMGRY